MASMNIRSGDTVEILVGGIENRGKRGKVTVADPEKGRVVVENLNMVTKHKKPRTAQEKGGKVQQPRAIDVSNVALVCPKCGKTTRVAHVLGENGKYLEVARSAAPLSTPKKKRNKRRQQQKLQRKLPRRQKKPISKEEQNGYKENRCNKR